MYIFICIPLGVQRTYVLCVCSSIYLRLFVFIYFGTESKWLN